LGLWLALCGVASMVTTHFADALGLGRSPGVGADQWLGILVGAGILGLGLILLLTPSDIRDLDLPPEPRVGPPAARRGFTRKREHARHL
jgi:hypothetical protein